VSKSLAQFHGKAVALDVKYMWAPLPLLFLVHEYRVCGKNFYQPTPHVDVTSDWQEWMVIDGVVVNEKDQVPSTSGSQTVMSHQATYS
jgi:hypothetical protein